MRALLRLHSAVATENLVRSDGLAVLLEGAMFASRMRLRNIDRLIFVWLYRCFPAILNAITVVKPETVIRWHRRGFRAYWRWKSRRAPILRLLLRCALGDRDGRRGAHTADSPGHRSLTNPATSSCPSG